MKKPVVYAFGVVLALSAGHAQACSNLAEAMKEFEGVKNAYVAKAPSMPPEMFQVWAKHIQAFGDAMGKQNYAAACATLAAASTELGLAGSAAATPPPPPKSETGATPPPPPKTETGATPPPPPKTAGGDLDGTWKECPRGRCRD